jgi:hypothetical protein
MEVTEKKGTMEVAQMKRRKLLATETKVTDDKFHVFLHILVNARAAAEMSDDTDRFPDRYSHFPPCLPSTPKEATPLPPSFHRHCAKSGEPFTKEPAAWKLDIITELRDWP